jgi:hypothetical protein
MVGEPFGHAVTVGTLGRKDVLEDHEKDEKDKGGSDAEGGFHTY